MQGQKYVLSSTLVLIAAIVAFNGINNVNAVTETTTARAVEMRRVRVSNSDINSAPTSTDPGDVCGGLAKRLVLYTVPAAGQVNSMVTKVRTAFAQTGLQQIGAVAIRAEQGGVQLSSGDIAMPHTDWTDTAYIENRIPGSPEYAFYDEDSTWNVVAYVCGRDTVGDPMNISSLTSGSIDFYLMTTRN